MEFKVGEKVHMKKPHACGSFNWEILRIGADFRISCLKCGRQVLISRNKFEKAFKKVIDNNE